MSRNKKKNGGRPSESVLDSIRREQDSIRMEQGSIEDINPQATELEGATTSTAPPLNVSISMPPSETGSSEPAEPPTKTRKVRSCSVCGDPDHDVRRHDKVSAAKAPDGPSWQEHAEILAENRLLRIKISQLEARLESLPETPSYAAAASKVLSRPKQVAPAPSIKKPSVPEQELRIECYGQEKLVKSRLAQSPIKVMSIRTAAQGAVICKYLADETLLDQFKIIFPDMVISPVPKLLPEMAIILPSEAEAFTDAELLSSLENKNDIKVEKFLKRTDTHLFVRLSRTNFDKISPHAYILSRRTRTFQSLRLRRCYQCHQLGHVKDNCPSADLVCGRCAKVGHSEEACQSESEECSLCKGPHKSSDFKRCKRLIQEQERLKNRTQ